MPNYQGHLVGGALFSAPLLVATHYFYPLHPVYFLSLMITGMLGALFPDVDTKSKGQRIYYYALTALVIMLALERKFDYILLLLPVILLPLIVRHRGLFHKLWFILAVMAGGTFYACASWPALKMVIILHSMFFTVGAFSHLYLDLGLKRLLWQFKVWR